jgi:DNA-binding CsgD family transcriptional regulator
MAPSHRGGPSGVNGSASVLVAIAERFYVDLFRFTAACLLLAAPLTLLTASEYDAHGLVVASVSFAAAAVALAVAARAADTYAALRQHTAYQIAPAFLAAGLIVIGPYGVLYFVSLALLLMTAVLAPLRSTILCAILCGTAYYLGVALRGEPLFSEDFRYATYGAEIFVEGLLGAAIFSSLAKFLLRLHEYDRSSGHESGGKPEAHPPNTAPRLTARQLEVLMLLSRGLTHAEAAKELTITEQQVDRHVRHVKDRLGIATVEAVIARLVLEGTIPVA